MKATPDYPLIHDNLWFAYDAKAIYDRALSEAEKSYAAKGDTEVVDAIRRGGSEGGYRAAMRRAAEVLEKRSTHTYVAANWIARLYAFAGDRDKAMLWLERGFREGAVAMSGLRSAPHWDFLRGDPRFQDLVRRMNFPSQGFAARALPRHIALRAARIFLRMRIDSGFPDGTRVVAEPEHGARGRPGS